MAYNYEYPYTDPNRSNGDWLLSKVKELFEQTQELVIDIPSMKSDISDLKIDVSNLQQFEADFKAGKYADVQINALAQWIDSNLQEVIARSVDYFVPRITNDGYFAIDVVDTLDSITFDTELNVDYDDPNWGALKMIY